MKTNVKFELAQADKKGLRTVQAVQYDYEGKVKLNLDKLAQSVANSVFRKLATQNNSSINFGIKVSRPFLVSVTINNSKVLDLANSLEVTDNSKLKIKNKLYKEDSGAAIELFKTDFKAIIIESQLASKDYKNSIEIIKPKEDKKK